MRTDILEVPGAKLHYEVRGGGPVLLLVCGGIYDAQGYAELADPLADRYTVVSYDRRGNSRSPLTGPPVPQRVEEHGDDAYRLLVAVGVTPSSRRTSSATARAASSRWSWPPATPTWCAPSSRTSRRC